MYTYSVAPPTVSVIIPVYNAEQFLAEAIESVLGQSVPPQQVIVVDDGSTDQSAQVARRYADYIHLEQQRNAGSAAARNRGVALAQGDFLAFLDNDDYWAPEKLALQLATFQETPALEAVYGQLKQMQALTTAAAERTHFALEMADGCHLDTLLIRRTAFDRVGPFDPGLMIDTVDWMWRARRLGLCTQVLPQVLAWRRVHDANSSIRQRTRAQGEYLRLIRKVLSQQRNALACAERTSPALRTKLGNQLDD